MAAPALSLRAGPEALALLQERGLRAEDVDVVVAASGGPKWLVVGGLDRYLFGAFLQAPRSRPLPLVGSSIGSWRLACLAQRDPVAALDRAQAAYVHDQRYPPRPSPALVSEVSARILDTLLGPTGAGEVLAHPWARLHVLVQECRGLLASEDRGRLTAGLLLAATANALSRRTLAWQMRRVVFHPPGAPSAFAHLADFPTVHRPLREADLREVLLASGSIPLVMAGRTLAGVAGAGRDGGIVDYHPAFDFGAGEGLVLYPHYHERVVPGWFDKHLAWRRAPARYLRRVLLLAPSPEFVARLPHGRIPDRHDFARLPDEARMAAWEAALRASAELAAELHELQATGRVGERVRPLA